MTNTYNSRERLKIIVCIVDKVSTTCQHFVDYSQHFSYQLKRLGERVNDGTNVPSCLLRKHCFSPNRILSTFFDYVKNKKKCTNLGLMFFIGILNLSDFNIWFDHSVSFMGSVIPRWTQPKKITLFLYKKINILQ